MRSEDEKKDRFAMLFGVGLDGKDGHYRQTKGENFFLVGGSEDTHRVLQDKACSLNEELKSRGRRLEDIESLEELRDIVNDAGM
jgi:hypothetical protein